MPEDEVAFSLIENALDFILEAASRLGSPQGNSRDLKYAVLHLCAGVDLVLKERLRREHWSLVFQNVNKANRQMYDSGSFPSVNSEDCLTRLEGVCGVTVEMAPKKAIEALRQKRNRLEHFGLVDSAAAIKATAAETLKFVLQFTRNELGELTSASEETFYEIQRYGAEFEEYVSQVMRDIGPALAASHLILICPKCSKETLVLDSEPVRCLYCSYQAISEDAATEYVWSVLGISWYDVKDGADWPLHPCPECGRETLVALDEVGTKSGLPFVCFACSEKWSLDYCVKCGCPYHRGEGGMVICQDCFDYQMSKD